MEIKFDDPEKFKLQRYNLDFLSGIPMLVKDSKSGRWARWVDVEPLLKAYLNLIEDNNKRNLLIGTNNVKNRI